MKNSFNKSMYEKEIFLYLLSGTFYYFKDKLINRIHKQKIAEGFLSLNSSNYKDLRNNLLCLLLKEL